MHCHNELVGWCLLNTRQLSSGSGRAKKVNSQWVEMGLKKVSPYEGIVNRTLQKLSVSGKQRFLVPVKWIFCYACVYSSLYYGLKAWNNASPILDKRARPVNSVLPNENSTFWKRSSRSCLTFCELRLHSKMGCCQVTSY